MKTKQANVQALQADSASRILPGDNLRKPSSVGARFDRSLAWVWDRVKNDPQFPKPVYRQGMCFFIERELDKYIQQHFVDQSSDRAGRARIGRERIAA